MKRTHEMPFGARLLADGGARFRLWAPGARKVELVHRSSGSPKPLGALTAEAGGWFSLDLPLAVAGSRYSFRIDGDLCVPDPASRFNPDDVHADSLLTDPASFDWPDDDWRGRPWHEAVIYELHVGCFTEAGTFAATVERLDDLVALGVTAIELMPVADFAGRRGWGYDGVLLYAPEAAYGTPDDLKQLVAAAHAKGLMVLMDVVYNHFGPDGNYLHAYAPQFFNEAVQTPWGAAINFDGATSRTVRDFFIHNALYWIEEFHLDGLRVDAVHAMNDTSPVHFIDELARAVRDGPGQQRHVHLVLENDLNDASRLLREPLPDNAVDTGIRPRDTTMAPATGVPRLADAQWNDDVHHALHVIVTQEADGYYLDYATEPVRLFGRALAEGFAYQGDASAYRGGESRGTPSTDLPPLAFVNSTQTHDQVGNRAFGDRIGMLAAEHQREDALRAVVACVLLAPSPPMLFMGEEHGASTPFQYFCDFEGELALAVTEGRRNEFGRFKRFNDPEVRNRIPDPNDPATFERSKLRWNERSTGRHAAWLAHYTALLRLRREHLVPWLPLMRSGAACITSAGLLSIRWPFGHDPEQGAWHLFANLSGQTERLAVVPPGELVYDSHAAAASDTSTAAPWSVRVSKVGQ